MVEPITFQTIFQFLQTISIMVGIAYYLIILQNQQKSQQTALESRNTQYLMQLYNSMNDEKSIKLIWSNLMKEKDWATFDEWWDKYGPINNPDFYGTWMKSMITYEMYGVMLKRGFLDIDVVDDIMSGAILMIWDVYGPIILGFRERYGYPHFQEHQEYLTEEIRKVVNRQHPGFKGSKQN